MARGQLAVKLGPLELRTPLIAASGTVGSVWEWASAADVTPYGAAVAKSVSPEPWKGRPAPRLAPTQTGMLNGIGIQNPGIDAWGDVMRRHTPERHVDIWGSAVAHDPDGYATVARKLQEANVTAIELNLSCPNLEDGEMFSFSPAHTREVVATVAETVSLPVGAKLSPNTPDIVAVATAARDAGADFVVLTNTTLGFGVDVGARKPLLSGGVGGYSGPGVKPISLRCVYEVSQALPDVPIVGCGGVTTGRDVAEYLLAGASAVAAGTVHLAEPKAGVRIVRELRQVLEQLGVGTPGELTAGMGEW